MQYKYYPIIYNYFNIKTKFYGYAKKNQEYLLQLPFFCVIIAVNKGVVGTKVR